MVHSFTAPMITASITFLLKIMNTITIGTVMSVAQAVIISQGTLFLRRFIDAHNDVLRIIPEMGAIHVKPAYMLCVVFDSQLEIQILPGQAVIVNG